MPATKTRPAQQRVGKSQFSLPTAPVKPSDNFFDYNVAIYGRKSIGKSTLASQFPHSLNFRFERGRRNLEIFQVPEDNKLLTWETFLGYLEQFCESDYEFAVIDSIDCCYERAFEHVCQSRGITHPNKVKNGYDIWNEISDTFIGAFDDIMDAEKRFVLLSHEKVRKYENPDGTELERIDMTLAPSAAKLIKERCEFVMYYGYADQDRVITIRNDRNQVECATGVDRFLDPDGTPIHRIEIPSNDPSKALPTLLDAWEGKVRDYDYVPPREPRKRRTKRTSK